MKKRYYRKINDYIYFLEEILKLINTNNIIIENLHIFIKVVVLTYNKILENDYNMYFVNKLCLKNLHNKIRMETQKTNFKSCKKIYNEIILINKLLLQNYDEL